jgi:hypothetical protein
MAKVQIKYQNKRTLYSVFCGDERIKKIPIFLLAMCRQLNWSKKHSLLVIPYYGFS